MLKYAAVIGFTALLGACSAMDKPAQNPDMAQCLTHETMFLIGTSGLNDSQIQKISGATTVRRLAPNAPATMDYRSDRVNVVVNPATGKVVQATCG